MERPWRDTPAAVDREMGALSLCIGRLELEPKCSGRKYRASTRSIGRLDLVADSEQLGTEVGLGVLPEFSEGEADASTPVTT
jgi:hypothetical protein